MEQGFPSVFADFIRTRALEREGIDTRYPDERNGQTITGLNELADYIEGLTAMDPSIAVIGGLWAAQVNDENIGAAFDPVCRLIADINSESSTPRSAPTQAYNPIKKTAGDSGGLFDVVLAHKFTAISAGLGEAMIDSLVSSALAP